MSARMAYDALTRTGGHIGPPLQIAPPPHHTRQIIKQYIHFNQLIKLYEVHEDGRHRPDGTRALLL